VDGGQAGDKLGHKFADILGVQVTNFLRDINKGGENFLMALLITFLKDTSSTADLHWKLLAGSISNKLARLLLNVLGGTGGFIHSSALLRSLTIANLLNWFVAFVDSLIESFLLEGDGTGLLKVLLTHLLLTWFELGDIGVVALLCVLVGTLQDGFLLQAGHCLLLVNTAKTSVRVGDTVTEVHSSSNSTLLLSS